MRPFAAGERIVPPGDASSVLGAGISHATAGR
jgi:hypothetical protein